MPRDTWIPPLALKARDTRRNLWEFPHAGERPVIGTHVGLADLAVDVAATREMIARNRDVFFVFIDEPGQEDPGSGRGLVRDQENAIYLGAKPFGEPYQTYACFDAFWVPPTSEQLAQAKIRSALLISYAAARPLLIDAPCTTFPAPYQFRFRRDDSLSRVVRSIAHVRLDVATLDRYLGAWSPTASLRKVLDYASAATQNDAVARPTFSKVELPITAPSPWRRPATVPSRRLRCALVVDGLDRGGLEEVVVQLAESLPTQSVDTFVCTKTGGAVAERLIRAGHRVYVTADRNALRRVFEEERPTIVSSHFAHDGALGVAAELGVPIVETIHNTYVWLDKDTWSVEWKRSAQFSRAVAVSELAKQYYAKWNPHFAADKISVISNPVDVTGLSFADRRTARGALVGDTDDFLFLSVASYDVRKNQLGLLGAFEEVAQMHPDVSLLCVGNVLDPTYRQRLDEYRQQLTSRERIQLEDYRGDIRSLLEAADAFVLDSFFEGWSIAATEALIAGVPVIHSECGSAQELVGMNGERGIVVPNPACLPLDFDRNTLDRVGWNTRQANTAELVDAMSRLVEDRKKWLGRRRVLAAEARRLFDPENTLVAYAALLSEVSNSDFGTDAAS